MPRTILLTGLLLGVLSACSASEEPEPDLTLAVFDCGHLAYRDVSAIQAAFADEVTVPGSDPEVYFRLGDLARITLDGDVDVFGDGRVRIVFATDARLWIQHDLALFETLKLAPEVYR